MNIYAFTNGNRLLAGAWHDEDVISLFANVTVDMRNGLPSDDAVLSALTVFSNVTLIIPTGMNVSVGGFSIFGGRNVHINPTTTGPRLSLTLSAVFGNIKVIEALPDQIAAGNIAQLPLQENVNPAPVTGQTVPLQRER